jgi:drug/metabolite transporter (DMT)-like permease
LPFEGANKGMPQDMTQNRPGTAIALRLSSLFLFMVMAALIKAASETVPPPQAVFFRSLFAFPVILIWLWQKHDLRRGLIPQNVMGHVWRGLFGTTAMALTFGGLGLLPLPEVTAIGYATPMFTVLFAALLLGERVRLFRLSAVALGLIGVMIVLAPRLSLDSDAVTRSATIGALMVVGASILRALVQIHVRKLVQTENTAAIVFYFSLTATCLSLLTYPLGEWTGWTGLDWVTPSWRVAGYLIAAGLIGGIAQILVTSSLRFGAASMLAPFDYSSMIFASFIGWVVFGELPSPIILSGAALVIAGGVLIIWRERQLGLDRSKAKANVAPQGTPE